MNTPSKQYTIHNLYQSHIYNIVTFTSIWIKSVVFTIISTMLAEDPWVLFEASIIRTFVLLRTYIWYDFIFPGIMSSVCSLFQILLLFLFSPRMMICCKIFFTIWRRYRIVYSFDSLPMFWRMVTTFWSSFVLDKIFLCYWFNCDWGQRRWNSITPL